MASYDELISKARQIKSETLDRANTALRVGGWMEEALRYLHDLSANKQDAESESLVTQVKGIVGAINEVASYAGLSQERLDELLEEIRALQAMLDAKQDELTWDRSPEEDSRNPVTSDGIYQRFQRLENEIEEFAEAVREELNSISGSVFLTASEVEDIWDSIEVYNER